MSFRSFALAAMRVTDSVAYEEMTRDASEDFRFSTFLTESDFRTRNGRQFLFPRTRFGTRTGTASAPGLRTASS